MSGGPGTRRPRWPSARCAPCTPGWGSTTRTPTSATSSSTRGSVGWPPTSARSGSPACPVWARRSAGPSSPSWCRPSRPGARPRRSPAARAPQAPSRCGRGRRPGSSAVHPPGPCAGPASASGRPRHCTRARSRTQRLTEVDHDWPRLDARLRALPGVGVWTSGVTRGSLGDPDAVPVGDYNLPALVGCVLGDPGRGRHRSDWDDEAMLALLAPYTGQRGRVIRLCVLAAATGAAARPTRRAPRARLSAHRYW